MEGGSGQHRTRSAPASEVVLAGLGKSATIALGMRYFLIAVVDDGEQWIYDGADVAAHLAKTQARRRSYQSGVKSSARVG